MRLDPALTESVPIAFVIPAVAPEPLFVWREGKLGTTPCFKQPPEFKDVRSNFGKNTLNKNIGLKILIETAVGQIGTACKQGVAVTAGEQINLRVKKPFSLRKIRMADT